MADNLNDLALIIKSHFPLVQVETSEEVRMMRLLERVSNLEGWPLFVWTVADGLKDRKSTRLNSSHSQQSRMPSSA